MKPISRPGRWLAGAGLALWLLSITGPSLAESAAAPKRPADWAQAVDLAGLPNLHKVSDDLYRGAQPTAEGMRNLEKLGVKTVVNLRWLHSDREKLEGTSLGYVHIPIRTWKLKSKHVLGFLKVVGDPNRRPVFVHCQHGADRTGTMAAFYRMVFEGWSKDRAIEEMTQGGYNYHSVWSNLLDFIRAADIDSYRSQLGIPAPGKPGANPRRPSQQQEAR
jgi:protein tyrosine phosphatase (PTP) superfamily phosphohydrolase (DUF442 family)